MPTTQELERHSISKLARMCQRIADDASVHELIAREAARLKREWVALAAQEENEKKRAARKDLHERMPWFLSAAIL